MAFQCCFMEWFWTRSTKSWSNIFYIHTKIKSNKFFFFKRSFIRKSLLSNFWRWTTVIYFIWSFLFKIFLITFILRLTFILLIFKARDGDGWMFINLWTFHFLWQLVIYYTKRIILWILVILIRSSFYHTLANSFKIN